MQRASLPIALLLLGVTVFSWSTPASAVPMQYTLTGTITGSLGDTGLQQVPFTIEMETWYVATWLGGPSTYAIAFTNISDPPSSTTIALDGIGTLTFTENTRIFLTPLQPNGAGWIWFSNTQISPSIIAAGMQSFGLNDQSMFSPFAVDTPIGTLCGTAPLSLTTTGGLLTFDQCGGQILSATATVIPIPAMGWALALTIVGLTGLRRQTGRTDA